MTQPLSAQNRCSSRIRPWNERSGRIWAGTFAALMRGSIRIIGRARGPYRRLETGSRRARARGITATFLTEHDLLRSYGGPMPNTRRRFGEGGPGFHMPHALGPILAGAGIAPKRRESARVHGIGD